MSEFTEIQMLTQVGKDIEPPVLVRIDENRLDELVQEDIKNGMIRGAHWFRKAEIWYQLCFAYNNPYNVRRVHSELTLITQYQQRMYPYLVDRHLVFLGIGTGDTEFALIEPVLDAKKYCEMTVVDVNRDFIDNFYHSLLFKLPEDHNYQICFRAINDIFEHLEKGDFQVGNARFEKKVFICIGGTIGNFDPQEDLFSRFARWMNRGDRLLLGFQLDTYLKSQFQKYRDNRLFHKLILGFRPELGFKRLHWVLNHEKKQIEAWHDNIQVFRSKKYNGQLLWMAMKEFGFELLSANGQLAEFEDDFGNSCIQIYEKK